MLKYVVSGANDPDLLFLPVNVAMQCYYYQFRQTETTLF